MGSNHIDEVMISRSSEAECSEATVEIKIKTLDSQTYTLRVDKCMPVPALKEQIATVTGVLSDQQRLICRGKVLKDDQLLSAYHVEDGHTLHLVVRQPLPPADILPDYPVTDSTGGATRTLGNQGHPRVLVGSFNLSEQSDGVLPDLGRRIVSALLSSFGATSVGSGGEGVDIREHFRTDGSSGFIDFSEMQPDEAARMGQSAVPTEHLPPLVIPDSLTTISQYLNRMRVEFRSSAAVAGHGNNIRAQAADARGRDGQESNAALHASNGHSGLPTPGYLAEVMSSTRQLLLEQTADCLAQLARQVEEHTSITDTSTRTSIQSSAMRSGDLLQKLGALLLELGRTIMTLRMGQTPEDAVVNAGPAVFITASGPNPIMVQPLPFQPGTSFGAIPIGNGQPGVSVPGGSLGSGLLPRNIDIRIRTGSVMPSGVANQGEPTDASPAGSGRASSIDQTAAVQGVPSSTREPEVRVLPIRTVVAAVPTSVRRAPSNSYRTPMGLFYPVLARVQHVSNGNVNSAGGSQTVDGRQPGGPATAREPSSESAVQGDGVFPERAAAVQDGHEYSAQIHGRLNQLLRTLIADEHMQIGDVNAQTTASAAAVGHAGAAEVTAGGQEAPTPGVTDEGIFLSNVLRQVMPYISDTESPVMRSDASLADVENRTTDDSSTQETLDIGTSSHRQNNPPTPPNAKRQKRE